MTTEILFWVLTAGFSICVGVWLALPLLTKREGLDPFSDKPSMRVHRAALAELERDLNAGLLNPEDAEAARVEIQRRLLKDSEMPQDRAPSAGKAEPKIKGPLIGLAAVILGGVPALAVGAYLFFGNPGEPDLPLASRDAERQQAMSERSGQNAEIAALRKQIEADPQSGQLWAQLGALYRDANNTLEAEAAFRQALERLRSPDILVRLADVLIVRADGLIPPEARSLLEESLERAPGQPQAIYFLSLAKLQEGDPEGALQGWLSMEADVPPNSRWFSVLQDAMGQAASEAGVDLGDARAKFLAENPDAALPPIAKGPSQDDIAAAQESSPEDRRAMIESMVGRLRDRLEETPGDVDGWLQLARSYNVLKDQENLKWALENAALNGPDRIDAQVNYAFSLYSPQDLEAGKPIPQAAILAMERVLTINPDQVEALLLLGIRDETTGFIAGAREKFGRILTVLDPGNPLFAVVQQRLQELPSG